MAARNNPSLVGRQPSQGPPPVRVLVVDDSETFRRMAAEVIAVAPGFALAGTAASGEEAIDVVVGQRPDLVLIDVRMPGIGGIAAAQRIAAAERAPVVVLISSCDREDAPGASGVDLPYLPKSRFAPAALDKLWADAGL
jgi:two-component system, NarL family, invasion response regulator UvrY